MVLNTVITGLRLRETPPPAYGGGAVVPYIQGEPYDYTTMEAPPRCPTKNPMFGDSERHLKMALAPIIEALDTKRSEDQALFHLHARLKSFEKYPELPKTSIFAARGECGAGTSATVSNLLGDVLFSEQSGSVSAVTKVPHEFVHCPMDDAHFQSTVHFKDTQNIHIGLSEQLETMYKFCTLREGLVNEAEREAIQIDSELARKAFVKLFRPVMSDFETKQSMHESIHRRMKHASDSYDAAQEFMKYVHGYLNDLGMNSGTLTLQFTANTLEDLCRSLEPYTSGTYYALVDRIRTQSTCPLLSEGLILTDVPGSNNCDRHRIRLAENYMTGCVGTLIVHPVTACLGSKPLQDLIRASVRQYGAGNVIVALTGTDMLTDHAKSYTDEESSRLQELAKELVTAELFRDSLDDVYDLIKAERDVLNLESEHKRIRVQAVSRGIVETLQSRHHTLRKPEDHILVTCISNKDHALICKNHKFKPNPILGPDSDGIKSLRQILGAAPSRAALAAAERHLQHIDSYLNKCTECHTTPETHPQGFKGEQMKASDREAMASRIAKAVAEVKENIVNIVEIRLRWCRWWSKDLEESQETESPSPADIRRTQYLQTLDLSR